MILTPTWLAVWQHCGGKALSAPSASSSSTGFAVMSVMPSRLVATGRTLRLPIPLGAVVGDAEHFAVRLIRRPAL
jgi:hypothetical protein